VEDLVIVDSDDALLVAGRSRSQGVREVVEDRKRAEHWVVVSGRARVTRGEDTFELEENQSTYIPVGTRHRLENPGEQPLMIIEVQSGSYLGEDDIERFEDRYNRS
jgi:mannose-6-phosphate isomerase-like protein (cupin superfamily)